MAVALLGMAVLVCGASTAMAQQPTSSTTPPGATPPPAIDDTITAGEAESEGTARKLVNWNEYQGPLGSIRFGFGFLWDWADYSQDDNSKSQVDLPAADKLRDFRLLFSGRLGFKRPTTWSAGVMYDANKEQWVMRQTGIMVAIPEIWGHIFVGRTKEGISLNKVMIGYGGWTMERSQMNDSTLPILADGVKWLGYVPKARVIWNLGFFGDAMSDGQTFSTYENQVAGRVAWLPLLSPNGGNLLHLEINVRYGTANEGKLRLRARPGAWPAPYVIDTAEFAAKNSTLTGWEIYYRPGRFTMGSEYFFQTVDAPDVGDPFFHGGEVFATWLVTGETRTYNTRGGYFNQISPKRTVFSGGPGAWEIVAHYSYADLDAGTLTGGKFWRFTPMLNWYLSDNVRWELAYGYGSLDRFGVTGKTQFFQTRMQLQL